MIKSKLRISGIVCAIIFLICATAGAEEKRFDTMMRNAMKQGKVTAGDDTPILITPFEARVLIAPTPFRIEGKTHLTYELAITNYWKPKFTLEKVEVFGEKGKKPLLTLKGDGFHGIIYHLKEQSKGTDTREIEGGETVIVYMWVTVENTGVPDRLYHHLTFREEGAAGDAVLDRPTVEVNREAPPIISPPLRGDNWGALDGPANSRKLAEHRFCIIPVQGEPYIVQRYAVDWMKFGESGKLYEGDISKNSSWHCYREKIYAVADGIVTMARGDLPENIPMAGKHAVPLTQELASGNFIILDIGNGRYAFYAHLIPGSLRVKVGDKVKRGQVIALLGNSGNSEAPHLHFHICGPVDKFILAGQGYPYEIDSFLKAGQIKDIDIENTTLDEFMNVSWKPEPGYRVKKRSNEMPETYSIVNFRSE